MTSADFRTDGALGARYTKMHFYKQDNAFPVHIIYTTSQTVDFSMNILRWSEYGWKAAGNWTIHVNPEVVSKFKYLVLYFPHILWSPWVPT